MIEKIILRRQACRKFLDKKVEKEKLETIINLSMLAPSACNSQPWKMYFVVSDDKVKEVAQSLQDNGMNKFASEAPCFIVVTSKTAKLFRGSGIKYSNDHFVPYDIGELVAYITLVATDLGLDSCILGWINAEKLRNAIGYSDEENSDIVIALGYGDGPIREKIRKTKEEIVEFI